MITPKLYTSEIDDIEFILDKQDVYTYAYHYCYKTYEQELTEDLISIIRYYSMKSYSNRRKMNKIKKILSEKETDDEINSEN